MSELLGISEKFLKIATQEIKEDLSNISKILDSCEDDEDISKNSIKIEKHMHNIKGLAPMMGKENIGNMAKQLDSTLKKIMTGEKVDGMYQTLCTSIKHMKINLKKPYETTDNQKQGSNIS